MKKNLLTVLLLFVFLGAVGNVFAGTEHQFDKVTYEKIVKKTIGNIITGQINPDGMLKDMERLVEIGVQGCKEHMNEVETPEKERKIMKITIDSASQMSGLSLDKIEELWHEGNFLKTNGIDISGMDHFAEVMCHYDAVVHPATAIICLKEYKKARDEELLEQIKAELAEVKEHLQHLE